MRILTVKGFSKVQDHNPNIAISLFVEPWILLRPVRKNSVEYLQMRDSIAAVGFLNSICVRPSTRFPGKFEIIDGNYRYHCALDLGLLMLPCIIKYGVSDDDVLAFQIEANGLRPKTTRTEYGRQLKRIFDSRPGMTFPELARLVHKNIQWVKQQLGLLSLSNEIQTMVDRGEIPVGSAYMLAKIPTEARADYVDLARTMQSKDFQPLVAGVIKQYREGVHQARMDERHRPKGPQPHLRALRTVFGETQSLSVGPLLLMSENCRSSLDGWLLALKWVLHLDRSSIEQQERAARDKEHRRKIKPPENQRMK